MESDPVSRPTVGPRLVSDLKETRILERMVKVGDVESMQRRFCPSVQKDE